MSCRSNLSLQTWRHPYSPSNSPRKKTAFTIRHLLGLENRQEAVELEDSNNKPTTKYDSRSIRSDGLEKDGLQTASNGSEIKLIKSIKNVDINEIKKVNQDSISRLPTNLNKTPSVFINGQNEMCNFQSSDFVFSHREDRKTLPVQSVDTGCFLKSRYSTISDDVYSAPWSARNLPMIGKLSPTEQSMLNFNLFSSTNSCRMFRSGE